MLIPYAAGAIIFSGLAILIGAAILVGRLDPKERRERAMRAHLEAHKRRQAAIVGILAQWEGGKKHPTTIEGEYTVEDRFRKAGAL